MKKLKIILTSLFTMMMVACLSLGITSIVSAEVVSPAKTTAFEVVDGASIRLSDPTGLRFQIKLGQAEYETLTGTKSLGAIIVPDSFLTVGMTAAEIEALTKLDYEVTADKIFAEGGYYYANIVVVNVKYVNLNLKFNAVGYIKDSATAPAVPTVYTPINKLAARDVVYIASSAKADTLAGYTAENIKLFDKFIQLGINSKLGTAEATAIANFEAGTAPTLTVALTETTATMAINAKKTLTVTTAPEVNLFAKWSSSNEAVATVSDKGEVTAISAGTATITVEKYGATATCLITVTPDEIYVCKANFENSVTITKEADGSWKYSNKTCGTAVDPDHPTPDEKRQNWGESGICFEEINKKGGAEGVFFTNGNKYLKAKIKVAENVRSIDLRFDPLWIKNIKIGENISSRNVNLFDADGKRSEILARNTWYTIYIPVEQAAATNCIFTNGGTEANPATMYINNLEYVKELPKNFMSIYANGGKIEVMTSGQYAGAVKYENNIDKITSGAPGEDLSGIGKIGFNGVQLKEPDPATMCGEFFKGFKYLKMQVNFSTNTTALTFYMRGDNVFPGGYVNSVRKTITVGSPVTDGNITVVDSANKNVIGNIEANTWYTIYLKVDYSINTVGYIDFCAYTSGGTATAPAVMYLRDLEMLKECPYNFMTIDARTATVELINDPVVGKTFKHSSKGTEDDRITFAQMFRDPTIPAGNSGVFFTGFNYVKMKLKFSDNATALRFFMQGEKQVFPGGFGTPVNNILTVGSAVTDEKFLVLDDAGNKVTGNILADTWYTVYLQVVYKPNAIGWIDFFLYTSGGTAEKPAITYLQDLEMLKNIT